VVQGAGVGVIAMRRVLITGGSGFLGAALAKKLIDKDYFVRILDVEDPKAPPASGRIDFIRGDVRDEETAKKACEGAACVIHNAAILPVSRASRKIFREVNVDGTRNILKASLDSGVEKVIFISSSAPYGIPKEAPITERTAFNPVCDYGRSKIEAEGACNEYRKKGLNVIILRPRTVVGKGRLGLFQILFSWIADNKNIYIINKGDNLFSLLDEGDFVNACVLSAERAVKNEDFNLGADEFRTVGEDLRALVSYAKSSSKVVSLPAGFARALLRALDALDLVPFTAWHYMTPDRPFYFDISKAKRMLGWQPLMGNAGTLRESYDWYLARRNTVDNIFGTTHTKSARQRILRYLKKMS